MARRGRSLVMSICLAAVALMACWQFVAPVFVQPKTNRGLEAAAPAAMGALVSMASSLPAEATVPAKGPLYGTELCTKPADLPHLPALRACLPGVPPLQLSDCLGLLRCPRHSDQPHPARDSA